MAFIGSGHNGFYDIRHAFGFGLHHDQGMLQNFVSGGKPYMLVGTKIRRFSRTIRYLFWILSFPCFSFAFSIASPVLRPGSYLEAS